MAPLTWFWALTVAGFVTPPLITLVAALEFNVPPVTVAPPLSWPALVTVPADTVAAPETVAPLALTNAPPLLFSVVIDPPLLLLKVPAVLMTSAIAALLVTVPPLLVAWP